MTQLDGAGQAKQAALDEAMTMVQRLHGIVERMAIAVRSNQNLAGFKRPREIVLVDELPKNSLGKIMKRDLVDHVVRTPR